MEIMDNPTISAELRMDFVEIGQKVYLKFYFSLLPNLLPPNMSQFI